MWNKTNAVIDDLNETLDYEDCSDIFEALGLEKSMMIEENSLDELIMKKAHEDTGWAADMAIRLMKIASDEISTLQEKVQIAKDRMRYAESMMRLP